MLKIDTAIVNYFPENCELRQDIKSIDKNFAGTNSLYFTIEGQEKGDLTNPEILKATEQNNWTVHKMIVALCFPFHFSCTNR